MGEALEFHFTDGRAVPVHFGGSADPAAPILVIHSGTPHTGRHLAPVEPLAAEADRTALAGTWSVLGADAEAASEAGSDAGEIDDDLAFVAPWGVDLGTITASVTLVHGTTDRVIPVDHARRLDELMPTATTEIIDGAGHVAVLEGLPRWVRGLSST